MANKRGQGARAMEASRPRRAKSAALKRAASHDRAMGNLAEEAYVWTGAIHHKAESTKRRASAADKTAKARALDKVGKRK